MTVETFFEKFELFADAPDAVASMRELILQFAVRGKLSDQLEQETCSKQLVALAAFKSAHDKLEESDQGDIPFLTPSTWEWAPLGDAMEMFNGRAFKPTEWAPTGTPIIRIQNLNNPDAAFNRCTIPVPDKFHVKNGDFLISWSGTPGTSFGAFIWDRELGYLNQHIFRCKLATGVYEKRFLRLSINARLDEMISQAQGGVGLRHITKGKLERIRLPLPPLAEQKRIVAKVDELMALCDRLEAQQKEREAKHAVLARAALARFAEAPTPANLEYLFHNAYTIAPADIRKLILTSAVRGRLLPQDESDELAKDFLARISIEKAKLVATKAIKPEETSEPIADGEALFEIPNSWIWVRAQNLCRPISSGSTPDKGVFRTSPGIPYLKVYNIRNQVVDFEYKPQFIDEAHHETAMKRSRLFPGDVIMNIVGPPLGKVAIIPNTFPQWNCNQAISFFRPIDPAIADYLYLFIKEGSFLQNIQLIGTAGQDNISVTKCKFIPVPLPPLAEQRRIVAKVEQLMAIVDRLEAQLAESRAVGERLMQAVVAELTTQG